MGTCLDKKMWQSQLKHGKSLHRIRVKLVQVSRHLRIKVWQLKRAHVHAATPTTSHSLLGILRTLDRRPPLLFRGRQTTPSHHIDPAASSLLSNVARSPLRLCEDLSLNHGPELVVVSLLSLYRSPPAGPHVRYNAARSRAELGHVATRYAGRPHVRSGRRR